MTELSRWIGDMYVEMVIDMDGSFIRTTFFSFSNIVFEGTEEEVIAEYSRLYMS